jgi:hypothetical protein
MQFESHLGHSISPRQRRFCFDVLTKLVVASSDGLGRGLGPDRRGGLFRCVGSGLKTLASGPSGCCDWGYAVPRSGSFGLVVGGQHLFMVLGGVHDMTLPDSLCFYLGKLLLDVCSVVGGRVCLAKRGVDTVNDYAIRIWLPVTAGILAVSDPILSGESGASWSQVVSYEG